MNALETVRISSVQEKRNGIKIFKKKLDRGGFRRKILFRLVISFFASHFSIRRFERPIACLLQFRLRTAKKEVLRILAFN